MTHTHRQRERERESGSCKRFASTRQLVIEHITPTYNISYPLSLSLSLSQGLTLTCAFDNPVLIQAVSIRLEYWTPTPIIPDLYNDFNSLVI